jgi:tRNA (guanine37-N1)-methyltransferase
MLQEYLKRILTEEEIKCMYGAYDIVGDIAVIKIPPTLESKKYLVADAILQKVKAVKTILRQSTPVEGDYRIRGVEWIGGENKTETIYREHGCLFKVDLSKVFFTPRLSTERLRVANQVKPSEFIINMFGGVGPFSILIAKKQRNTRGISIDINPNAHRLATENIKLNKVDDRVTSILGDAKIVISETFKGVADRVLMPLPENASKYLDIALIALRPSGGIIHYYTHRFGDKSLELFKTMEKDLEERIKFPYRVLSSRMVREVGPRWHQVVCDISVNM